MNHQKRSMTGGATEAFGCRVEGRLRAFDRLKAGLRTLHCDERGAIAVLVMLIIWCLVAILGLIWNTGEEAYRRQRVQTAADAAAHAASTWMSRTLNAVTAENMVISQDASEETIWRAVPLTDTLLNARMTQEEARIAQMRQQQNLQVLLRRIAAQLANIATERQLMTDALSNIESGVGANYADANETLTYANKYRQIQSVSDWVWNTYVQGQKPPIGALGAPPRPGPPGPNGEGLAQIVQKWQPPQNENAILDYILNFINGTEVTTVPGIAYHSKMERGIIQAFEGQTGQAAALPIPGDMAKHENDAYLAEQAQVQNLVGTIEAQRATLAQYYQMDITLASLQNQSGHPGPADITAPLMRAKDAPPVTSYTDSIRSKFAAQAAAANLSPVITIDAINVHVNPPNNLDPSQNAIIWHPDMQATVRADILAQYPSLKPSYTVHANSPDGWGHIWAMPLEHYVHQRVNRDMQEINSTFMVALDQARTQTLAAAIRQMLGLPNNGNINIANLPAQLPDDQPEPNIPPLKPGDPVPPPRFDLINVMPSLTAPANATAAFRAQVALYNQHGGAYTGAVRALRGSIISYTAYFSNFTNAFASDAWNTNVNQQCVLVLAALGQAGNFMVLSTYGLRPTPDWAQRGMHDSVTAAVENQLMLVNIQQVAQAIVHDLQASDPNGAAAGILDQQTRNSITYAAYIAQATQMADSIVRTTAHQIAEDIADEWVYNRPWPYEITPPDVAVPPFRGISPPERQQLYTVMAAARQTDATAPHLLLNKLFGTDATKLVAYAQGETFNWMEFNPNYGGGERYDQVVVIPEVTHFAGPFNTMAYYDFVGAPRGWRVDSIGGWNWRTRLSLSDTLYGQLQVNDEFRSYLQDAGINSPSSGALDAINLH